VRADLAIAFISLHDIDAMRAALGEAARILKPGGRFCFAIVHPINSAGRFETATRQAPFVIKGDYLQPFAYSDAVERDGLSMTFHSHHRASRKLFFRFGGSRVSRRGTEGAEASRSRRHFRKQSPLATSALVSTLAFPTLGLIRPLPKSSSHHAQPHRAPRARSRGGIVRVLVPAAC
jgi:SAM-dependent methyltransferase